MKILKLYSRIIILFLLFFSYSSCEKEEDGYPLFDTWYLQEYTYSTKCDSATSVTGDFYDVLIGNLTFKKNNTFELNYHVMKETTEINAKYSGKFYYDTNTIYKGILIDVDTFYFQLIESVYTTTYKKVELRRRDRSESYIDCPEEYEGDTINWEFCYSGMCYYDIYMSFFKQ